MEILLASYIQAEEAERARVSAETIQWAMASNAVVARYGSPADEHTPF